jgi:hypothetical protein
MPWTSPDNKYDVMWNSLALQVVRYAGYMSLLLALLIIGASLYVLLSDWGYGVDKQFLLGPCLVGILYGTALTAESTLGLQGVRLLYTRIGVLSGHTVIGMYLFWYVLSLGAEVCFRKLSLAQTHST